MRGLRRRRGGSDIASSAGIDGAPPTASTCSIGRSRASDDRRSVASRTSNPSMGASRTAEAHVARRRRGESRIGDIAALRGPRAGSSTAASPHRRSCDRSTNANAGQDAASASANFPVSRRPVLRDQRHPAAEPMRDLGDERGAMLMSRPSASALDARRSWRTGNCSAFPHDFAGAASLWRRLALGIA